MDHALHTLPPETRGKPVVALVALHLTTRAHTLTEHDSVNLAHGLRHFDVVAHAPHPPGYPLVVAAAHLFAWVGGPVGAYVAGGFRPTMLPRMLPTCVVGVVLGRPSPRRVLAGAALGLVVLVAWAVPVRLASFWPTAAVVRAQDTEARFLPAVVASCPADSCAIVSLPTSLRYWCRDAASIAPW